MLLTIVADMTLPLLSIWRRTAPTIGTAIVPASAGQGGISCLTMTGGVVFRRTAGAGGDDAAAEAVACGLEI